MKLKKIKLNLQRFAEGGGATGSSGGASGAASSAAPGAAPSSDGAATTSEGSDNSAAPENRTQGETSVQGVSDTDFEKYLQDNKSKADAWFQKRFDARHTDHKSLQEQNAKAKGVMELVGQKYGWDGKDIATLQKSIEADDSYFEQLAMEKGISVKDARAWANMERENAKLKGAVDAQRKADAERQQAQRVANETKMLQQSYPKADVRAEFKNPQFVQLTKNGVDFKTAYEIVHRNEIMQGVAAEAERSASTKIAASVAANKSRPTENGTRSTGAASAKVDVANLSKSQMDDLIKRARSGERITFT